MFSAVNLLYEFYLVLEQTAYFNITPVFVSLFWQGRSVCSKKWFYPFDVLDTSNRQVIYFAYNITAES